MTKKHGFVYIWFDKKHKRYYIGCHWGTEDDGYVCSSVWMMQAYRIRPEDFKRKILKTKIVTRAETYKEEQKWLNLIKESEIKPQCNKPRYYNLNIKNNKLWHSYEEQIKNVGQKISSSKKGRNTGPRDPEIGRKISDAKKGIKFSIEHCKKISESKKGFKHTEEWKQANSKRLKEQWNNGTRKRSKTKIKMSRKEQDKKASSRLKSLWADPIWAANQKKRLSEGSKNKLSRKNMSKNQNS